MRNTKGFTLIELLAMMVVIGVLMAVTIPNITGILTQTKTNVFKEDVDRLVTISKTKFTKLKKFQKPNANQCIIFTLSYLDDNKDIITGPNDGKYYRYESFVIIKKEETSPNTYQYNYYVRLVEKITDNGKDYNYGINGIEYRELEKNFENYLNTTGSIGLTKDSIKAELISKDVIKGICNEEDNLIGYYAQDEGDL